MKDFNLGASASIIAQRIRMETFVCDYCSPSVMCMYDIGIGPKNEYLNIQQKLPHLKFYGCEPDPRIFPDLQNKFPGTIYPVAVGETLGSAKMYLNEDQMQTSIFPIKGTSKPTAVSQWTLDFLDDAFGNPKGILLWMDIEGSELKALKGGTKLLSSGRVQVINLEVRDTTQITGWCTATEIDEYLSSFNYVLETKYNHQGTHWDVIYRNKFCG